METLEQFRNKLVSLCVGTKLDGGVHTVTFQLLKARVNQDRVMTEKWDIGGQTWLFLAVCDGELVSASQRVPSSCNTQVMVELKRPNTWPNICLGAQPLQ